MHAVVIEMNTYDSTPFGRPDSVRRLARVASPLLASALVFFAGRDDAAAAEPPTDSRVSEQVSAPTRVGSPEADPPREQYETQTVPRETPEPPYGPTRQDAAAPEAEERFDDGLDFYLAPGALNLPYGGVDSIDYGDSFDPGYQWGLGLGYFVRTDSPLAIGVGGFFDHAIINSERRSIESGDFDHVFRIGLELKPGVVLEDRVFLYVPLRGGWAAEVVHVGNDTDVEYGGVFGVGGGIDVAVTERFYLGTVVGTDLHYFRSSADYDAYLLAWRTHLGWRF